MRAKDCATLALTTALLAGGDASAAVRTGTAHAALASAPVPEAFRVLPGAHCSLNRFGLRDCSAPGYALSGDPDKCPVDGYFGSVFIDGGVDLLDRPDDPRARVIAHLHDRQFICVGADAGPSAHAPSWTFVIVVPTRDVPDCRGTALCKHADFPVRWTGRPPALPCRLEATGRYTAGCAAGWVRTEAVDLYANGIWPTGD